MADELLYKRVTELEKKMEGVLLKLDGAISRAAVSKLTTLRQNEINEIKQEIERLTQIVTIHMSQP